MGVVQEALKPIEDYLISTTRNTIEGWYEIEIGIPSQWAISSNSIISCTIIEENEVGKYVKITPLSPEADIDRLYAFVELVIKVNEKISEKEALFEKRKQEMKKMFEDEALEFYKELDDMKELTLKPILNGEILEKSEKSAAREVKKKEVDPEK